MTAEIDTRIPRRGARPERETREEILEAAAQIIVADGFAACTMRSISEKVAIKAGSLYYHFASKDEIVLEIMNKGASMLLDEVRGAVGALPVDASFLDKFRAAVEVHVSCKLNGEAPFMRVYEHLSPDIKRQGRLVRRQYSDFWIALIDDGKASFRVRKDLNSTLFVSLALSSLNHVPEWFNRRHMRVEEVADLVVGVLTAGILIP